MLELVPDNAAEQSGGEAQAPQSAARTTATVHYIYDPFNPPLNAIISVARRLQSALIEFGGLPEGGALPFPALAPDNYG